MLEQVWCFGHVKLATFKLSSSVINALYTENGG